MIKKLLITTFVLYICAGSSYGQYQGPGSSQSPYVIPVAPGVKTTSILTVQDKVGDYSMIGIPDGLGAFDNDDGTFTLLMNHELGSTLGAVRAHGSTGSFSSRWIIKKSDLSVVSGEDLIKEIFGWNTAAQKSETTPSVYNLNRLCSADLPATSAFFNAQNGKGSTARIFMHGEEGGATGYQLASVATGPDKGKTYVLGKFNLLTNGSGLAGTGAWENSLACPYPQDKTIVIGNNDGGTDIMRNAVSVYIGTKTKSGSEVDKAGLTNGTLSFVNVANNPVETVDPVTRATNITSGTRFSLTGTSSTSFSRPEDGAWDPMHPDQYYFVTTDQIDQVADGIGIQIGRSRLWRLTFDDIKHPEKGGVIDMLLDGTEGQTMMDNMTIDHFGHILLQEDVGNNQHNGKIWQYTIATDQMKLIAKHDPARFGDINMAPTDPYNMDEESSGILDMQEILGPGMFLLVDQAHYDLPEPFIEGGQLLALYNPDTEPAVTLSTPNDILKYQSAARIKLNAQVNNASDPIVKVRFYNGATLLHTETKDPYGFLWIDVAPGEYDISAKAYDDKGNIITSNMLHFVVVGENVAPYVSFVKPSMDTTYAGPGDIRLIANAKDPNGKIVKLDFFVGNTLLLSQKYYPYTYTWRNVQAGTYEVTAVATDDEGLTTISAPITITVGNNSALTISSTYSDRLGDKSKGFLGWRLSPNPVQNMLTVSIDGEADKQGNLSIMSISGTILRHVKTGPVNRVKLDVSTLAKGIYLLKYSDGEKTVTRRFLKL